MLYVGNYGLASIRNIHSGRAGWCAVGDLAFGYKIKAITLNHVVFVRQDSKEELTLTLSSGSIIDGKAGPERYTKAWINSRANPMLIMLKEFPMMHHEWSKFTDAEKEQVKDFYRKHGWKLVQVVAVDDTTEFTWRNIYTAERSAAIKANYERFEQNLSPDQKVLWKKMQSYQTMYPDEPGRFSDAQRAEIAARQPLYDQFEASLTPEQQSARLELSDFTKADWK